jgi:transcription initiation factor TFIIIB Brf1 subunit/transcription initiation factor TFIIB
MDNENLLTLHCPQCKQLAEVVTENNNLVCLECGWRFDEKTAARFLTASTPANEQPTAPLSAT